MNERIIYITRPDEWFDTGTEVELVDDYRPDGLNCGLFRGYRNGKLDEEICPFDEFNIVERSDRLLIMNIAFLVFRNNLTGYGHWYRSKALADYLKSRGHKVTIIGDYQYSRISYVDYNSLLIENSSEMLNPTLFDHIIESWFDWIIVDLPFELDQSFYQACKSKRVKSLILNGIGHQVGDLADLRIVQGLGEGEYSGPDYVILRDEIIELRHKYRLQLRFDPRKPKWFVFGGGFDPLNLGDKFIDRWLTDDFILPSEERSFLQYALECNRACLSMGMIVWELLTIGLKCYVFSVSPKHLEFAMRMNDAGLIRAYPEVGIPKQAEFVEFLQSDFVVNSELIPDGKAKERIERLIING